MQPCMPPRYRRTSDSRETQQEPVNDTRAAGRIVQRRDQEDHADRDNGDTLEYAQRARVEQKHVLGEQRKTHQPAADREAGKVDNPP